MNFTYMLYYTEDGVECSILEDAWHHQSRDIIDVLLESCVGKGDSWTNIYAVNENDERLEEFDELLPTVLYITEEEFQKIISRRQEIPASVIAQEMPVVERPQEAPATEIAQKGAPGKIRRITRAVVDMFKTPFD